MNPVSNWNMFFKGIFTPVKSWWGHIHHSVSWDRSRAGIVNVLRFKNQLAIDHHRQTVAVSQCKRSVVILSVKRGYRDFESQVPLRQEIHIYQNRVEVFYPEWIYRAVQYQPDVVGFFHLECFSPKGREDSICPVVCGNIKSPEHLTSCKKLWQLPYFIFDWWSVIVIQEAMENFVFPYEIKTKLMRLRKLMNIFYVP